MFLDGLNKSERDSIFALYRSAKAWHMDRATLESLSEQDRSDLRDLVDQADEIHQQILKRLPPEAMKARYYLLRFSRHAISYLRELLDRGQSIPAVNTNAAEMVFSQVGVRLKKIGRRWSAGGALNMLRVLLTKALNSQHWEEYLQLMKASPGGIEVECRVHPWRWSYL